jgi:hypothetical protein
MCFREQARAVLPDAVEDMIIFPVSDAGAVEHPQAGLPAIVVGRLCAEAVLQVGWLHSTHFPLPP